jgi:hypothetical protein
VYPHPPTHPSANVRNDAHNPLDTARLLSRERRAGGWELRTIPSEQPIRAGRGRGVRVLQRSEQKLCLGFVRTGQRNR